MGERVTSIERAGLVFDVRDDGPLDGEPVVLLHGFPERATSWRHVAPLLNAAGCRTLAMDQRGYAPRARPRRRRDYRLPELAADTAALVRRVGGSAHLVGHDWGGAVAWAVAQHHPDRVRTLTAVSAPHPQAFLDATRHSRQLLKSWYMGFFQLPWLPEAVAGSERFGTALRKGGMTADDVARFRREIVDDGALRTALHWYRAVPLTPRSGTRAPVRVPTTVVWSDGDVAIERWGAVHSEQYVEGPFRLVALEGVSHWIPTEAPEALAEAVLDRVRG